jgi:hypothetical protein
MKQDSTKTGKILRVKAGYNPNSSSVGSQIPTFFAYAAGTGIFAVVASQILNMIKTHNKKKKKFTETEKQK